MIAFADWLEWAEPIAYGPLALKPWEFERLQPHEFAAMLDGYKFRQEQQENILAYFAAGLMNVEGKSLKRALSPADLVKPLRMGATQEKRKTDADYLREKFGLAGGEG